MVLSSASCKICCNVLARKTIKKDAYLLVSSAATPSVSLLCMCAFPICCVEFVVLFF